MKNYIKENKSRILEISFVLIIFIFYLSWMIIQPYAVSPDESMRYDIPRFIFNHGTLPTGWDPELLNNAWGYSYAFYPMLSYIISAFFMKVVSIFTMNTTALLMAARTTSLLCSVGTAFVSLKIGKKLFNEKLAYLFACIIAFLPQNVFMSSYVNTDALAIFSTALIVYGWIIGIETKWNLKSCIFLGVAISLCALSYFNAYGFILCSVIIYFITNLCVKKDDRNLKKFFTYGFIIVGVVLLLAGWWFIRNAIIYNGDFLGMKTCDICAELNAAEGVKPSQLDNSKNLGESLFYMLFNRKWLVKTLGSFIGCFGVMNIPLHIWMYVVLAGIIGIGLVLMLFDIKNLFRVKRDNVMDTKGVLSFTMLIALIIPFVLNLTHSYSIDFQPQGRYILPLLVPLAYFVAYGFKRFFENKGAIINAVTAAYVLTSISTYFFVYAPNYL